MNNTRYARARPHHTPGQMNKTEQEYTLLLEIAKRAGEITDYRFEAMKLRLASNTFYTPDFLVIRADGEIELREIKGHWEDDARVKIKVAAEQYPWFRFLAVTKQTKRDGGGWKVEEF